jgi:short subunit dehydrogenase-like uncharacterized protein
MSPRTIAVYGATGHTGKFVVRELERRGHPTVSIARNRASPPEDVHRNAQNEWRYASCDDPDALDDALRGAEAVINCAGPFLDTAPALAEAALRAGIHYFDVTAEQRSARQTLATFHEEARARGTVVLPAMAFYGGLADLLAAEVTQGAGAIDSIEIGVALDYWHPTAGTRRTGDRNTARRLVIADGRLAPMPRPAPVRDWMFPEPFGLQEVTAVPLSEIVTIGRHIAARNVCSYMNSAPLRDLSDARTPPPTASEPGGQSSQRFVMDVQAVWDDRRSRITVSGQDIYGITAPIVVEACLRVLEDPPATGGAFAPGELYAASCFLAALAPHLEITVSHGARSRSACLDSGIHPRQT